MGTWYQGFILLCSIHCFMVSKSIDVNESHGIIDYQQKIEQLRALKKVMRDKHQEEVVCCDQINSRSILDIVLLAATKIPLNHKNGEGFIKRCVSIQDSIVLIKSSLSCILAFIELARMYKGYRENKRKINLMTYEDFIIDFPHLVIALQHVLIMRSLIALDASGTFPQQIFARIHLAKMSLPLPYADYANSCAQQLYTLSFDKKNHFIWVDISMVGHVYKKFYKKVPQDFKRIVLEAQCFPEEIHKEYLSPYAVFIDNDYNNTLIDMIYAGIKQDYEQLYVLSQKYSDGLVNRLYRYYVPLLRV